MLEYWIDNIFRKEKNKEETIFQKCFQMGKDLPCFCYHERLSIAGNCRMCLVEVNNSMKLLVACGMPLINNVRIFTSSERVKKARQAILEILLSSHPLDCPICDQAGECDLQDINLVFGSERSRFYELNKRAVLNKDCGIFIRTVMTRCIHCTRCVRFLSEVTGERKLGMLGRGSNSEISTYVFTYLNNELSGNIIDLCPVGALTSNPYMFTARPWELNNVESVDFFDLLGASIRIDYFNNVIYRVLPLFNKDVNEDWITNKVRFAYDSNKLQRLINPLLNIDDGFYSITWLKAFYIFWINFLKYSFDCNINPFLGNYLDIVLIDKITKFFNFLGSDVCLGDNIEVINENRNDFFFNLNLLQIENYDNFLFLWFNSRLEMPLLNSRLKRFEWKKRYFSFGNFSNYFNFGIKIIGVNYKDLFIFLSGKLHLNLFMHKLVFGYKSFLLKFKFNICCFFGIAIKYMYGFSNTYKYIKKYVNIFCSFVSAVHNIYYYMGYLNILELGVCAKTFNGVKQSFVFLMGVDELNFLNCLNKDDNFIVYSGSHFDIGASVSNLVLPYKTLFEYSSIMFNFKGSLCNLNKVVENFQNISDNLFQLLLNFIFFFMKYFLFNLYYRFVKYFKFFQINWNVNIYFYINKLNIINNIFKKVDCKFFFFNTIVGCFVYNYYKTDIYTRNSKIMHIASIEFLKQLNIFK